NGRWAQYTVKGSSPDSSFTPVHDSLSTRLKATSAGSNHFRSELSVPIKAGGPSAGETPGPRSGEGRAEPALQATRHGPDDAPGHCWADQGVAQAAVQSVCPRLVCPGSAWLVLGWPAKVLRRPATGSGRSAQFPLEGSCGIAGGFEQLHF